MSLNFSATPSIVDLFLRCSPSTVFRAVVAIYIDSVNRMRCGWSRTHVCYERCEIMPSVANGDTASTPQSELWMSAIETSRPHSQPGGVFECLRLPASVPVRAFLSSNQFAAFAAAGLNSLTSQVSLLNNLLFTAGTSTEPQRNVVTIFSNVGDYGQSAERVSNLHVLDYSAEAQL